MRCIDHVHKALPNAFQLRQYVLACIDENVTEDSFIKYREELERVCPDAAKRPYEHPLQKFCVHVYFSMLSAKM